MMMLPPWMPIAEKLIGIKEVPGPKNNDKIMEWAKIVGGDVEKQYTADSIPWCGLFVAYCLAQSGIEPVKAPLWALNWSKYGQKLSTPVFGAVFSMHRKGGGHTGFIVSQDSKYWHILGGNQSDSVNVTRIAKANKCYFNFPIGFDHFKTPLPVKPFDGTISHSLKFD